MRTRSAASALVSSGHVRVNGDRVTTPSRLVRVDDVITVALDRQVRILKVTGFAERRGGGDAGRALYADLTPAAGPDPELTPSAVRAPGAGRPTKRERRTIDRWRDNDY